VVLTSIVPFSRLLFTVFSSSFYRFLVQAPLRERERERDTGVSRVLMCCFEITAVSAGRSQKEVDGLDTWARGYHTCTAAGINASNGVAAARMGGAFGWGMLHVGKSVPPRHLGAASGGLMPFFGGSRGARGMSLSGRAQTKLVVMSHPGTALCPALVSFAASFVGHAALRR
jgi:hypothetical protein